MVQHTIWYRYFPGGLRCKTIIEAPDNETCVELARLNWDHLESIGCHMENARP